MQEEVKKENTATGKEATERLWVGWDSEVTFSNKIRKNILQIRSLMLKNTKSQKYQ